MNILKKFRNPITWIIGEIIKFIIQIILFRNISNTDFRRMFSYTLDLLPNETFINLIQLLINTLKSNPKDILSFKLFNEVLTHSIPQEHRTEILSKAKLLFVFLIIFNITKRILYIFRSTILLPFKLGVYSFIASLIGLRPDYLLSFFDAFKFNIPNWIYNKLIELHLSWLSWFKNILQINSITTDMEKPLTLPRIKKTNIIPQPEIVEIESKSDTYFYLTKTQWVYVSISVIGLLAAYFGYTGGIPFTKSFEWESSSDDDNSSESGSNLGVFYKDKKTGVWIEGVRPKTWTEGLTSSISKLNPFNKDFILNKFNPFIKDTPQIPTQIPVQQIPTDPVEREAYHSDKDKGQTLESKGKFLSKLKFWKEDDNITPNPDDKKEHFLKRFWKNHDSLNHNIRVEQLERNISLSESDREELRHEYKKSKDSSPTHSDPDTQREYTNLFRKPESSSQDFIEIKDNTNQTSSQSTSPISIKRKPVPEINLSEGDSEPEFLRPSSSKSSLYSVEEANDSTDTITQASVKPENKKLLFGSGPSIMDMQIEQQAKFLEKDDNIPTDVTASELTPLTNPQSEIEGIHTYPPRPKGKEKITEYFPGVDTTGGLPFARGFNENIDLENINKGKVLFSSSFVDSLSKYKEDKN